MKRYALQVCTPSGEILSLKWLEARDVYAALARANRRASAIARSLPRLRTAAPARIDVADQHGHTVARLLWSETVAALG